MQLLQDVFIVENLQILTEGKNKGPMKIRGVFGRCNEKNNNGRIYPTVVLESQLKKVQPLISERRLCGELDHPQNDTVKLSNASHLITKLEMKGNELIGEAEVLSTPAGLTAQALINGGVKIGISSRGMGTLSEDRDGNKIVNEDFKLVTFDLVADPSTRGAYPGLSESTESKFVRESQSKLTKEANFVTLLKSKMRASFQPFIEEGGESAMRYNQEKRAKAKKEGKPMPAKPTLPGGKLPPVLQKQQDDMARKQKETNAAAKKRRDESYLPFAYAILEALGIDEATIRTSKGKTHKNVTPRRAAQVNKAALKRGIGSTTTTFGRGGMNVGDETKTFGNTKNRKSVANVRIKTKAGELAKGKKALGEQSDDDDSDDLAATILHRKSSERSPDPGKEAGEGSIKRALRQRSEKKHAKGMEVARAKGSAKGAKILAKGDVAASHTRRKGLAASKAGKPVTGGEKAGAVAKAGAKVVGKAAKAGAKAVTAGAKATAGAVKDSMAAKAAAKAKAKSNKTQKPAGPARNPNLKEASYRDLAKKMVEAIEANPYGGKIGGKKGVGKSGGPGKDAKMAASDAKPGKAPKEDSGSHVPGTGPEAKFTGKTQHERVKARKKA